MSTVIPDLDFALRRRWQIVLCPCSHTHTRAPVIVMLARSLISSEHWLRVSFALGVSVVARQCCVLLRKRNPHCTGLAAEIAKTTTFCAIKTWGLRPTIRHLIGGSRKWNGGPRMENRWPCEGDQGPCNRNRAPFNCTKPF